MRLNQITKVQQALNKDQVFIENIVSSINNMLNTNTERVFLYQDEIRKVSCFKNRDINVFYIVEEKNGNINLYQESLDCHEIILRDDIFLENLKNQLKQKKEELYLYLKVCSITSKENAIKKNEEQKEDFKSFIESYKKENPEKEWYKIKSLIEANEKELPINTFFITYDVYTIAMFTRFLNKYFNGKDYSYDFYLKLSQKAILNNVKNVEGWHGQESFIRYMCRKYNFDKENNFEVGDGDCYVWLEEDDLFIQDQSCTFYFNKVNNENYQIYVLNTEMNSIKNEMKKVAQFLEGKNDFDIFKLLMLEVKNNEIVYINEKSYNYAFDIVISTTTTTMFEEIKDEEILKLIENERKNSK